MNGSGLRAWRRANGLRQIDLAEKLGVTQSAVSRWECGIDEPSPPVARRILAVVRDYSSNEIARERLFLERSPVIGVLLDLEGMRLIATSAAHRKIWPGFQSYIGKYLIEDLVGATKMLAFDETLHREAVEGELVQVRGRALEHTRLDPGTCIGHEWQANFRKAGNRTLIEVQYDFNPSNAFIEPAILRISDLIK